MAVDFNGDGDYINLGDITSLDGATDFSFSLWIKFDSLNSGRAIMQKWGDATNEQSFLINEDAINSDEIQFAIESSGGNAYQIKQTTNANLTINTWYSLICTFSAPTNLNIYIDGVAKSLNVDANNTITSFDNSISNWEVGFEVDESRTEIDGQINEVAAWNIQLTQIEIDLLVKSRVKRMPLQIRPSNLKLYLPLDDLPDGTLINGQTFKDLSGNGNDGTGVDADNDSTAVAETILSYP